MELTGRLSAFPIAALLQWAQHERRTGVLALRQQEREKRLLFSDGAVVGCVPNHPREYYGHFLLSHGHLESKELMAALARCRETGKRLGAALIALGLQTRAAVSATLQQAATESICDLFLWRSGLFYFEDRTMPVEDPPCGELDTMGLVLEGMRWIDEAARIRKVLVSDEIVLRRGPAWPGENLSAYARFVLRGFGQEATIHQLWERTGGVHFALLQETWKLMRGQVLEIARIVEPRAEVAHEPDLRNLLLEQAAREEILIGNGCALVPLEFLEHLCPIWLRRPPSLELDALPPGRRRLLHGFDGRSPLRLLLSREAEVRDEQLEELWLRIKQRSVILLPMRFDEVERELDQDSLLRRLWGRVGR